MLKLDIYFREWDIFWFWDDNKYPDYVNVHLTIDTLTPAYPAAKSFGCNRWDDNLEMGYKPGTDNGPCYNMPECYEISNLVFRHNGIKVGFWDNNCLDYIFGVIPPYPETNVARINYLEY